MKTLKAAILLSLALLLGGCASVRRAGESTIENLFRTEIPQKNQRKAS